MNIIHELSVYPSHMKQDGRFATLKIVSELAKVLVETKMHLFFPLIYRLVKLTLVLPVATATVERCFSAMKLVKMDLRNRIEDEILNDCVIFAVEREEFSKVTNEKYGSGERIKIGEKNMDQGVIGFGSKRSEQPFELNGVNGASKGVNSLDNKRSEQLLN
ncbi:hypothetical protein LXL04_019839 [Taraxacum kok-saghyz]